MINFEADLLPPIQRYVGRQTYRHQATELPFFEYRIDIYALSIKLGLTIAIELKLQRWRRAFVQAQIYQLCADLVYLALPANSIPRVDLSLLYAKNVGLISVADSGRCRVILPSKQSLAVESKYKTSYMSFLRETQ